MNTAATLQAEEWRTRLAERFEQRPESLIPALQYVQGEAGYLPPEGMTAVAEHLKVSRSKVFGVASFYAQFHFEPRGRNTVTVCRGTACHVRGSAKLLSDVERQLGMKAGGTTRDLEFSLETVACYGSCALAPVVVINNVVHRQQTSSSLATLLAGVGDIEVEQKRRSGRKHAKASSRAS